jgi:hypothetical protein
MPRTPYKLRGVTPYEQAFNTLVDWVMSHTPLQSMGVLTQHTVHGVIRKAQTPNAASGGSAVTVVVCDPATGTTKTYQLQGQEVSS